MWWENVANKIDQCHHLVQTRKICWGVNESEGNQLMFHPGYHHPRYKHWCMYFLLGLP
jgi:hypothetical protein